MNQALSISDPVKAEACVESAPQGISVPKEYLDPPSAWNPTLGLFLGGYGLAALTIWQWCFGDWPLQVLVALAFLALPKEAWP